MTAALLDATRERVSPFVQRQAVRALALLDAPGVREEPVSQRAGKRTSRPAVAIVAVSLGRIRDPETVPRLLDLARDDKASDHVRVAASWRSDSRSTPSPAPAACD